MYLQRFELISPQTAADVFYFFQAQECDQVFHRPRDLVPNTGQWGSFPGLGDENPTQRLEVRSTLRVPYGETVNGTTLDSWSDMVDVLDQLFRVLNAGMGKLWAIREDNDMVWAYAKPSAVSRPSYPDSRRLIEVPVTFEIHEGHWYGDSLEGSWALDEGYYLDTSGLYLDTEPRWYVGNNDTFELLYHGNAIGRDMTIEISTYSGTVTDPKISNANTGEWIQWTGTVGAYSVTIDTGAMYAQRNGVDQYSAISNGTTQFDWMTLYPLTLNLFTFTCSGGGTAEVEITVYPHYAPA